MVLLGLLILPFGTTLMALSSARQIAALPAAAPPFDRPFFRGLIYVSSFYIPVLGYFYYWNPAWALAYLIDPSRLPVTFGAVVASLAFSGYFFFYLGTQALLRSQRLITAWLAAIQPGLATLTFAAIFENELTSVGAYFDFHTGVARPLSWDHGLAQVLVGAFLVLAPFAGVILWNRHEEARYPEIEPEDSKW